MHKKFEDQRADRNNTSFTKCYSALKDKWIFPDEKSTWAMRYFWIMWQDMMSRACGNYLGIYGAIEIYVASQSSKEMNIPFNEKGIYGIKGRITWDTRVEARWN